MLRIIILGFTLLISKNLMAKDLYKQTFDLQWQKVAELESKDSQGKPIGLSAMFTGIIDHYLVIAGGANFPNGHPVFDKANKVFHSNVYVYDIQNGAFDLVAQGQLPVPQAYGATIKTENGLWLVGGKNENGDMNVVLELTLDRQLQVHTRQITTLPFTWSNGAADIFNNELYLFAGNWDGKAQAQMCRYSFSKSACEVTSIPGLPRVQFASTRIANKFYIFSGIAQTPNSTSHVLTDSYSFDFEQLNWQALSEITFSGKPFSVAGGSALALDDQHVLILGGVNKKVFDDALKQLTTLEGEELINFKKKYFAMSPEEFNFSRQQFIFNIPNNEWLTLNKRVPFYGGAGPLQTVLDQKFVYWLSGEIKAVERTPAIYRALIINKK